MKIDAIEIFRAEVPLTVPYKVSRWTFTAFHPLIASIRTRDGRVGWGEATITAGPAGWGPDVVNETSLRKVSAEIGRFTTVSLAAVH